MASYTDQPYKFNPYVSTLPVEAMVKVGMQKQQRYDENVQKIQAMLDEKSALPVLRSVDSDYINSLMGQVQTDLSKMTGADFSEQQVFNSVAGMVNKIGKDQNVLAAVQSYNNNKKQMTDREAYKKEGKISTSNDYDYNSAFYNYLNSNTLGETFNHSYTPYTDVRKKAMEILKALHPNLQGFDMPFDETGGISTGKIADAMKRYKVEGITEGQIETALRAGLGADDWNQLRIDGNYQFRDVPTEQLVASVATKYEEEKKQASQMLTQLKEQRPIYLGNQQKTDEIDSRIAYYEELLGSKDKKGVLDLRAEEEAKAAVENPESLKYSFYKEGFIKQFSNAFKWESKEMSYVTSPLKAQENWNKNFAWDVEKEKRRIYEDERDYEITLEKHKVEMQEKAIALFGTAGNLPWVPMSNPTISKLESSKNYQNYINEVQGIADGDWAYMRSQGLTDKQITDMIAAYEANPTKNSVNTAFIGRIQSYVKNRDYAKELLENDKKLREEADKESGFTERKQGFLKGQAPLTISAGGESVTLSPTELLDLSEALARNTAPVVPGRPAYVSASGPSLDVSKLTEKQQKFLRIKNNLGGDVRASVDGALANYGNFRREARDLSQKSYNLYQDKLSNITTQFIPRVKPIFDGTKLTPPPRALNYISWLTTSTDLAKIAADGNTDAKTIESWLSEDNNKDTRMSVMQAGDKYEVWLTNKEKQGNVQKIRITKQQANEIFGPGYVEGNIDDRLRLDIGKGKTNISGDPQKAILRTSYGSFRNIPNMVITADLMQDGMDPNLFIPLVNVKKKDGSYQPFMFTGKNGDKRVGYEQGKMNLQSMTQQDLLQKIREEYPEFDISQLDIK